MPTLERPRRVANNKRSVQPKRPTVPRLICESDTKPLVKLAGLRAAAGVGRDLNQAELVHALIAVAAEHPDEVVQFLQARDEADEHVNGESE